MSGVVATGAAQSAPPAWDCLRRASFRVQQQYRYAYRSPIRDLRQRLMMLPSDTHGPGQRLVQQELRVDGADDVQVVSQPDRFGNVVCHVFSQLVERAVEFTAEFTVERHANTAPLAVSDVHSALYLAQTSLTAPCTRIRTTARELAAAIAATPIADLAAELLPQGIGRLDEVDVRQWAASQCGTLWAARAITYQFGATGVQTPAAMALHLGRGVCQDFSHLAIAMLRELRVPVRYVSGHLLGEGAPHAWIESLLPDPELPGHLRVVAYDPTHSLTPSLDYITVAVGRDYNDIAPTSGTFQGPSGQFTARKRAWLVEAA